LSSAALSVSESLDTVMITPVDFAFVSAKLHGMRSRLHEGPRLEPLTGLRNVFEMMRSLYPGTDVGGRTGFERRLVEEHIGELMRVLVFLDGPNRDFFEWQLERYRIENLKVVLRGWKLRMPREELEALLVTLPPAYALPTAKLLETAKLIELIRLMPVSLFAEGIRRGSVQFHDTNRLFYIEAGLDAVYFEELCRRAAHLSSTDAEEVKELLRREVLIYDVLFIMRARLNYDLTVEDVREFLVTGTDAAPQAALFESMLRAQSFGEMLEACPEQKALLGPDGGVPDLDALQRRLWERLYLAANRMFYRSMFHMGCVEAFYYIKRVELRNLIRVAELLRQERSARDIQRELIRLPEG